MLGEDLTKLSTQILQKETLKLQDALLRKGLIANYICLENTKVSGGIATLEDGASIKISLDTKVFSLSGDYGSIVKDSLKIAELIRQKTENVEAAPALGNFTPENLRRLKTAIEKQYQINRASGHDQVSILWPRELDWPVVPGYPEKFIVAIAGNKAFRYVSPPRRLDEYCVATLYGDPNFQIIGGIKVKDFLDALEFCAVTLSSPKKGTEIFTEACEQTYMVAGAMELLDANLKFLKLPELTTPLDSFDYQMGLNIKAELSASISRSFKEAGIKSFSEIETPEAGIKPLEVFPIRNEGVPCFIKVDLIFVSLPRPAQKISLTLLSPELEKRWREKLGIKENPEGSIDVPLGLEIIDEEPNTFTPVTSIIDPELKALALQIFGQNIAPEIKTGFITDLTGKVMSQIDVLIKAHKEKKKEERREKKKKEETVFHGKERINISAFVKTVQALCSEIKDMSLEKKDNFYIPISLDNSMRATARVSVYSTNPDFYITNTKYQTNKILKATLAQTAGEKGFLLSTVHPIRLESFCSQVTAGLTEQRDVAKQQYEESLELLKENYPEEVFEYGLKR